MTTPDARSRRSRYGERDALSPRHPPRAERPQTEEGTEPARRH